MSDSSACSAVGQIPGQIPQKILCRELTATLTANMTATLYICCIFAKLGQFNCKSCVSYEISAE